MGWGFAKIFLNYRPWYSVYSYRAYPRHTYSYGYDGCPSYGYSTYYQPQPYYINYGVPLLSVPAELNFGPQAVQRFMGAIPNRLNNSVPNQGQQVLAQQPAAAAAGRAIPVKVGNQPRVAEASFAARTRAERYVEFGDSRYGQQEFHPALQRYKSASRELPNWALPHFRQGMALVATGRYELAAEAFKRGVALDPDWIQTDFQLSQIYGIHHTAKTLHLESLAQAALADNDNADLMFLVGTFLYFDGQPERSLRFFERSAELLPGDEGHVLIFLRAVRPENAALGAGRPTTRI